MTNRAANCLHSIIACLLACAAITTIQFSPAVAAGECLAKPKEETPAGKHWFYRSDRATKRQCWYLRDDDAPSRGASLAGQKSAAAPRKAHTDFTETAANARAELPPPPAAPGDVKPATQIASPALASVMPAPAAAAAPPVAESIASAQNVASAQPAPAPDMSAMTPPTTTPSTVTSRWPEASGVASSIETSGDSASFAMASAEPSTTGQADATLAAATASVPVNEMEAPASPAMTRTDDLGRTQLIALLAAVAVAGFSSSVLLARARARRQIRLEPASASRRRITHWPAEPELDRMRLSPIDDHYPAFAPPRGDAEPHRTPRLSVVQRDHMPYDDQFEVEELLSRYSGQMRPER